MRYRKNAMIVAAQPESTEAGAEILKAGGNAVDAAMACALVQGVVDPLMCGIAGFGSCGIAMPAKGFHGYIDFHAPAPRAVRPDMWADLIESEAAKVRLSLPSRERHRYQSSDARELRPTGDAHREHGRCRWSRSGAGDQRGRGDGAAPRGVLVGGRGQWPRDRPSAWVQPAGRALMTPDARKRGATEW